MLYLGLSFSTVPQRPAFSLCNCITNLHPKCSVSVISRAASECLFTFRLHITPLVVLNSVFLPQMEFVTVSLHIL